MHGIGERTIGLGRLNDIVTSSFVQMGIGQSMANNRQRIANICCRVLAAGKTLESKRNVEVLVWQK